METNGTNTSHQKRIGIVHDFIKDKRVGGAGKLVTELVRAMPPTIDYVLCPPTEPIPRDCAGYVSFLLKKYPETELAFLADHPRHVRCEVDWWMPEEPNSKCRNVLANNAAMTIYQSPLHFDRSMRLYEIHPKRTEILPPPIDPPRYAAVREQAVKREDNTAVWAGEWHPYKGADLLLRWAERENRKLHIYGIGAPEGQLNAQAEGKGYCPDGEWLSTLASYSTFVNFPRVPDVFNYTFLEAYLLGLEVQYTNDIGCLSYGVPLEELALSCASSGERFWSAVEEVLA